MATVKINPTRRKVQVKPGATTAQAQLTKKATIEAKVKSAERGADSKAMKWFYDLVGSKLKRGNIPDQAFAPRRGRNVFIGGMFVYGYDPKHKDTLPWYDTLPCVIPIEFYPDGWLGLNLHYLPPILRAKLLDTLMTYRRRAGDDRAYMKLSYGMLKGLAVHPLVAPCIKRYLAGHVTTPVIRIDRMYWDNVALLPLQQFKKARASQVWAATRPKTRRSRRKA